MTQQSRPIPRLETDRLILRAPQLSDFEHRAAFYASERSTHEDGPKSRAEAWREWASEVGQWHLMGYGPFSVEDRATGAYLGEVGIYHPEGYPEAELGWFVVPQAEGKGIAMEAAQAVLDWAAHDLKMTHLVNYIAPANDRSIALAKRLGGVQVFDRPGSDDTDVVLIHQLGGTA